MKIPSQLYSPALCLISLLCLWLAPPIAIAAATAPGVAVLMVDTDRVMGNIDESVYGQFLEHINHSVVDGLFAEQIQGCGFEGKDFETYWKSVGERGRATVVDLKFKNGER